MATQTDLLKSAYKAQKKSIAAADTAQQAERQQREAKAQQTLESANRGVFSTYKNAIAPQGRFNTQNNFSSGVSDYMKNAAYGTMLQGIGTNQYNYNDAINNSNTLWNNWVAQKAGLEADAMGDYADKTIAQRNRDEEFGYRKDRDKVADNQWQLQFDLDSFLGKGNLKLAQDRLDYDKLSGDRAHELALKSHDLEVDKHNWGKYVDKEGIKLNKDQFKETQKQNAIDNEYRAAELNRLLANDKISQEQWKAEMDRLLANDKTAYEQWLAEMAQAASSGGGGGGYSGGYGGSYGGSGYDFTGTSSSTYYPQYVNNKGSYLKDQVYVYNGNVYTGKAAIEAKKKATQKTKSKTKNGTPVGAPKF